MVWGGPAGGEKHPEMSPYVYTANNPVKYIDPDGRDFTCDSSDES